MNASSALSRLIQALEEFHAAAMRYEDPEAPQVLRASAALSDAYIVYDDALFTQFGVEAPLDTFDVDDDDFAEEDEDFDDVEDFDDEDDDFDEDDFDDDFDEDDDF